MDEETGIEGLDGPAGKSCWKHSHRNFISRDKPVKKSKQVTLFLALEGMAAF